MEKNQNSLLRSCFYAFFVSGIGTLIIGSIMPEILVEFNIGYNKGGMLLSSYSIGNLLASFLGGMILLLLSIKSSVIILTAISTLGFFIMTISKSYIILLLSFFLIGIGKGSITNVINTIVKEVGEDEARSLNILHMFFAVGAFISPLLASWMFKKDLGWKFVISSVVGLFLTVIIIFFLIKFDNIEKEEIDKKDYKGSSTRFLNNIYFYISSGILFFYVGSEYAVNGWTVTYLRDTGLMDISLAQRALSLLWLVMAIGRLFNAYISKFTDKKTTLFISSIGTIILFILFTRASENWTIITSVFGLGFFLSGIYPTTIANASYSLEGSNLGMGILLAIGGLGGVIMPFVTGAVAEEIGIAGGMIVIGASMVLMFLLTLINKFKEKSNIVNY